MIDPGGEESAAHLSELLTFYGFERVQRACWESTTISEKQLGALKREIDRVTDYYDVIRIYQYPVEGVLTYRWEQWYMTKAQMNFWQI